ncbi:MAG TPA: molybdopterin-dependent oxidoreductase [Solirubrobacteraceae bacterium]|nr:molybdopterin-dependent oxidoreductase [Solirubrobacteraceae bacterium]
MTPRGTDWGLALLVALGLASGLATWFAGSPGAAWVFSAHALAGLSLTALLIFKLRRVLPGVRTRARRDRRTLRGVLALGLVVLVLVSGLVWASAGRVAVGGFTVLFWHGTLGAVLAVVVLTHARVRAKRVRSRDILDRHQFLTAAAVGTGAVVAWQVQRPLQRTLGLPGASRRFTGSYDAGSFTGNDFPSTSWVADAPRPLSADHRLTVTGRVHHPLALTVADLDRADTLTATLDCTGGFYSTQHWHGTLLSRLLGEAGVEPDAHHVRIISRTGYRWSFNLTAADHLLLATHVGDEPLTHGHGAPCRLVAPGRRGFQWVKWIDRIEVHENPDPGAVASTVWSSLTAAGRGAS